MHAARGFTLLEVLVAFTVLALAMGALMQVFSRGVNNADVADRYAKAAMVAESLLASTGIEETLAEGETNGETEGYQWRRSVKLYVSGTEVPSPSTLELNAQANAAARGIATAPSAATINPASTGATLGNVDVDSLLIVRLYEIEVSVAFTTDDGRTRAVTLNTMKIGPRV